MEFDWGGAQILMTEGHGKILCFNQFFQSMNDKSVDGLR